MNRLPIELERLYGLSPDLEAEPRRRAGANSTPETRVAVLSVSLPAGWGELSAVWRGVQSDLELPAPAIAVSGFDALQLWFSLASPTPTAVVARFLDGLRGRYLPDIASSRVQALSDVIEISAAPCVEVAAQRWSAFITHDLASVFAETPWLDIPPSDDGQATILRGLAPIAAAAFEAASNKLGVGKGPAPLVQPATERAGDREASAGNQPDPDPARFLSSVMTDATAPLALRIEAARILLSRADSRER
jgi:hypothetical protein